MQGNFEFLVLFIPVMLVGITSLYFAFFTRQFIIVWIILILIGIFCILVDLFALLVQYINWKYYKE
ncbi:MAG: hypothetical protein PHX27_02185 [Candidatus ainarchaeum sp.]|nr:hypothetical protein [Candidatus ainarchaeum sp.]